MADPVDWQARGQALDPGGSFIVQAPAGSGKTGLLVRRFLGLLTTVEAPEQILAITFTRKATAEMRQRIVNALAGLDAEGNPEQDPGILELAHAARERDRLKGWDLAQNPRRLRVQTIDSFCYELVRRMPWSARFGTVPPPLEDASRLHLEAAGTTLDLVEEKSHPALAGACARVLGLVNANRGHAQALLADMLAGRDRWMQALGNHSREQFEGWWQETIRNALEECDGFLDGRWRGELAALAGEAADRVLDPSGNAPAETRERLAGWAGARDFPAPVPGEVGRWRGLSHLLLTRDGTARRQVTRNLGFPPEAAAAKKRLQKLLQALAESPGHLLAWNRVALLPDPEIGDSEWRNTEALLALLPAAAAHLRVLFSELHHADFTEIAQRADLALGAGDDPSDLTLALDYQLRHVLMDEFQDTSSGQIELLGKLLAGWVPGDGRTLFLVGDPMQSIYRFREAEVGIFLDVQDRGIRDILPGTLTLETNFRSAPELVEWFNRAFPHVMPARRNITLGAVNYTPASAFRPPDSGAGVHVHAAIDRDHEAEAGEIAALIEDTLVRHPGEEIAVLGRTRGHLSHIMDALNTRGIPFQGIRLERLAERQAVQDMVALTLALAQPADQVAWLGLLRAPWGGVTLPELVQLVGTPDGTAAFEALRDDARLAGLPPDTRARLNRVREVMSDGMLRHCRLPLHRNLEACWLRLGGPAVVEPADLDNCRRFIGLVRDLEAEGISIHGESLAGAMEHLYAENNTERPVKLMTIHGAKGLEFHTVILPGLQRTSRPDSAELIRWKRLPDRLLIAPKPRSHETGHFYNYLGELEKEHKSHERGRLLYVACTRAQRRLHLFGSARVDSRTGEPRPPAMTSLLYQLWPAVKPDFEAAAGPHAGDADDGGDGDGPPQPVLHRIDPAWRLPELPASVDPGPGAMETADDGEVIEFDWARETTRIAGIVIHQALQQVDRDGWEAWKGRPFGPDDRDAWRRQLLDRGLPASGADEAVERVKDALSRVQRDPVADWIFSPRHTGIRTEWALSGVDGGMVRNVVLDRSFVDADDVRWVVDFKSSRHEDRDTLDAFIAREKERYRVTMTRYGGIVSALEGRPVRTALYYPVLGSLVEYGTP